MGEKIFINKILQKTLKNQKIEFVERKGIGHPDTIADAISEKSSIALCKMYLEMCGKILHHNTDETQIVAGSSKTKFGGGKIIDPTYILISGRATTDIKSCDLVFPCKTVILKETKEYLKNMFNTLDVDSEIILDTKISYGSDDLNNIFSSPNKLANDTSFGVGYSPFSITEKITYEVEKYINGNLKKKIKESGYDVKVMTSRIGKNIFLNISCAFIDKFIFDGDHYKSVKEELTKCVKEYVLKILENYEKNSSVNDEEYKVEVELNSGDDYKKNIFYLTCTGLSMEMGDDGSVGRGNHCNGLITPYRYISKEAIAGKNPVTHVGKIYNVLSKLISEDISKEISPEVDVYVKLLSKINTPVSSPLLVDVNFIAESENDKVIKNSEVEEIVKNWLENTEKVQKLLIEEKISIF